MHTQPRLGTGPTRKHPFCRLSNSTTSHQASFPRKGNEYCQSESPRATEGVGWRPRESRQRASWRRCSSLQTLKDRHSWGGSRAASFNRPGPVPGPACCSPHSPAQGQLIPPRSGQRGPGCTLGLGKDAGWPGHSHSQATSEGCFSHPHMSPSTNRAPSEFTKTNAPTGRQCPGRDRTASAGQTPSPASKPGLPDSHDPVILGGPGMGSILGPKGSDITRSPSPGLQAHLGPQKPSKGRPLAYRPATGHPIPFWANELSCPRDLSRLRSLDFASSALQSHCPG